MLLAVVAIVVPAFVVPSRPPRAATRGPTVSMGWKDPNWNWGSAVGTAHDAAMKIRSDLSTAEARKNFLFTVFAGTADPEDAKLALALKCQRARNLRYDDKDWEGLMEDMAACKFEGETGPKVLCDAIRKRLTSPPAEPPGIEPFNVLVAAAFTQLEFVEKGC